MPLSALPKELQDVENHFPDDDQYNNVPVFGRLYRWYQKKSKTWFAFSYRCTEWWARWRKYPVVLIGLRGKGSWRWEGIESVGGHHVLLMEGYSGSYLSRIQYYAQWHVALQWPLMFSCHFYNDAKDVPIPFDRPDVDGKLWFFYWNHFDADLIYWMLTSLYFGRNWK